MYIYICTRVHNRSLANQICGTKELCVFMCIYIYTPSVAMENSPFIEDLPLPGLITRGYISKKHIPFHHDHHMIILSYVKR